MKVIIVTGTPATGKTKVAKILAKKYNLKYININELIKKSRLYDGYNKKLKAYIINIEKLNKFLIKLIKNSKQSLIIDSHLSHYLNKKYVDLCIVVKCDISILKKRLEKRHYPKLKIRENLDSEIFDVCLIEAKERGHKIKVIDTSKNIKMERFELFK